MPAAKCNYIILFKNSSQVYSTSNLKTAVVSPPPKGCKVEDRVILFTTFSLDDNELHAYVLDDDQIQKAMPKEEVNDESDG